MANKTREMLIKCAIAVFASIAIFTTSTEGFEDGDFVKIANVDDGNVLTVSGTDPLAESNIKAEPWQNLPNQKWLAVQAVVASDNYLLIPQRQHWNWNRFINRGVVPRQTKDRDGDLPDWTMVLTFDSTANSLIQQPRHGKGNQQWKSKDISSSRGKILIKSIANGKCLKNSSGRNQDSTGVRTTTASPSFFQSAKTKFQSIFGSGSTSTTTTTTTTPNPNANINVDTKTKENPNVILADCDELDKKQQWTLEKITDLLV